MQASSWHVSFISYFPDQGRNLTYTLRFVFKKLTCQFYFSKVFKKLIYYTSARANGEEPLPNCICNCAAVELELLQPLEHSHPAERRNSYHRCTWAQLKLIMLRVSFLHVVFVIVVLSILAKQFFVPTSKGARACNLTGCVSISTISQTRHGTTPYALILFV